MDSETQPIRMKWSIENEEILVEWCDYAQCYKWLNYRAEQTYSYLHAWFTISTIVLSTISGTASFAQASYPASAANYIPLIIGSINIFVGMLNTVQQYLKISELKEAHRVSEIAWGKLSRNILIELAKAPNERMDAKNFFKIYRNEYDRLIETNPTIPEFIIDEFKNTFVGDETSEQRKKFSELRKPDICDSMTSANNSRHKWYKHTNNIYDSNNVTLDISGIYIKDISMNVYKNPFHKKNSSFFRSINDIENNIFAI
jgi:hypothetical protein